MADDFVPPVKVLIKAIEAGITLGNNITESAEDSTAERALQISELAPGLIKSLERSNQAIRSAYKQNIEICGETFTKALVDDKSVQKQLKDLRSAIRDKLHEIDEDADYFDQNSFIEVQYQAQECSNQCLAIFGALREKYSQAAPVEKPKDDRALLSSMRMNREPSLRKPVARSSPSPSVSTIHQEQPGLEVARDKAPPAPPKIPKSPWIIENPSPHFTLPYPADTTPPPPPPRKISRDVSPGSRPDVSPRMMPEQPVRMPEAQPRLIPREIVDFRTRANDEWLERRRQSRIMFQNELRKSTVSIGSIDENKPSPSLGGHPTGGFERITPRISTSTSPVQRTTRPSITGYNSHDSGLERHEMPASLPQRPVSNGSDGLIWDPTNGQTSPAEGRASRSSLNDYNNLMTRQRSQGQASQATRSSWASSNLNSPQTARPDPFLTLQSGPLSPPISEHRTSGGPEHWAAASSSTQAPALRLPPTQPDFSTLEVVSKVDYDNGLMVVGNVEGSYTQPTPTSSMKSIDYPMRHDTSFYKFKGFCDGAKVMLRGETGFKVVKRPSGHYSATISARCIKCSYEVGWNDVEKDRMLDRAGIYGNSGVRWRQKFISKCHLRTDSIESSYYACIFCIDEHRTVEDHDATVFFSVTQLFRHIATHSRPLPYVAGIDVLYGRQPPTVVDFDIHMTVDEPKLHTFCMREISQKVATRASASALITFHPKLQARDSKDPDGLPALHFAAGARIVGITFPEKFGGNWCIGYHDGLRGSFPASAISLEKPAKEDVLMDAQSTLVTYAKWDFKPKDTKDGDWLRLSKGDKILCIGYTFPDSWCWSGQTAKGKWGLFPRVFVEQCQEGGRVVGGGVQRKESSGFGMSMGMGGLTSKMSILGRKKSKSDMRESKETLRRGSVRSNLSNGSGSGALSVRGQEGLEVVSSPIHGGNSWR